MMNEKSQREAILRDMKLGWTITPLDAWHNYGCIRLAARVYELRQRGQKIETTMVRLRNSRKRVASYRLVKK